MALSKTSLFKIAGVDPGLWIYKTTDAIATVTGSGYFNDATNELKQFDVIIVVDTDTSTTDVIHVTSATGAATVTTSGVEGITAT